MVFRKIPLTTIVINFYLTLLRYFLHSRNWFLFPFVSKTTSRTHRKPALSFTTHNHDVRAARVFHALWSKTPARALVYRPHHRPITLFFFFFFQLLCLRWYFLPPGVEVFYIGKLPALWNSIEYGVNLPSTFDGLKTFLSYASSFPIHNPDVSHSLLVASGPLTVRPLHRRRCLKGLLLPRTCRLSFYPYRAHAPFFWIKTRGVL